MVKSISLIGSSDLENVLVTGGAGLQEGWQLMTLRSTELGAAYVSSFSPSLSLVQQGANPDHAEIRIHENYSKHLKSLLLDQV